MLAFTQDVADWKQVKTLGQLQTLLACSKTDMLALVETILPVGSLEREEVAEMLQVSMDEINDWIGSKIPESAQFHLHSRALHVYLEASNVEAFSEECDKPEPSLEVLGGLMNASHTSCSFNFQCSCPELDALTKICREAGALGSRLTGAGWGGCTVSLVPLDKVDAFYERVVDKYYAEIPKERLAELFFATEPAQGASIWQPE